MNGSDTLILLMNDAADKLMHWWCWCTGDADALMLLFPWCTDAADAMMLLILLMNWCCWGNDVADTLTLLMPWCCWCADAAYVLMRWCCWCAKAADALMLLNQDQDLLADLSIAICSSYHSSWCWCWCRDVSQGNIHCLFGAVIYFNRHTLPQVFPD